MIAMRYRDIEGNWENELVFGGTSVFTETGVISTFTRTSELAFGYSGKFSLKGDDLVIVPEVCSIATLEGAPITRTVKKLTPETLLLGMIDDATGRNYEIELKLLTRSFAL